MVLALSEREVLSEVLVSQCSTKGSLFKVRMPECVAELKAASPELTAQHLSELYTSNGH